MYKFLKVRGSGSPLPLIIVLSVVVVLIIWLTKSGILSTIGTGVRNLLQRIGALSSNLSDIAEYGSVDQANSVKSQVLAMEQAAEKRNLKPSALHEAKAAEIWELMDYNVSFALLSNDLPKNIQEKIMQLLINNSLQDQAMIILAYGERAVPARLWWYQVLFKDTSGTLRDHVTRYFTDKNSYDVTLHYINHALKTYLS